MYTRPLRRVTSFRFFGRARFGLSGRVQAVRIQRNALHDVGKIAVPDDVLRHPGKLGGREQWEIMQQHPTLAR